MALYKEIENKSGVVTKYHRITSIDKITNRCILIEVSSYTSKEKREEEAMAIETGTSMDVYIDTNTLEIPYEEAKNIKDYYAYLKTTEKFKDAVDA